MATLIFKLDRALVHQAHLSAHISPLNSAYSGYHAALAARLARQTGDPVAAQSQALALVDTMVHRQAAMLAYNDIAWVFGVMFLATVPLLFLLSRKRTTQAASPSTQP